MEQKIIINHSDIIGLKNYQTLCFSTSKTNKYIVNYVSIVDNELLLWQQIKYEDVADNIKSLADKKLRVASRNTKHKDLKNDYLLFTTIPDIHKKIFVTQTWNYNLVRNIYNNDIAVLYYTTN